MLPVTELRAALPLGLVWGLTPRQAFLWAVAGNLMPVLPALLAFGRVFSKSRFDGRGPAAALVRYAIRRRDALSRWGPAGVAALVAVPLPGTGVWTGCLVAAALGLNRLSAAAAVSLGAVAAGLAVAAASCGVVAAGRLFGVAGFFAAGAAVVAAICFLLRAK